jgi:hypothetical protein
MADLFLVGKCQFGSCEELLEVNHVFCFKHWAKLPEWAREAYNAAVREMDASKVDRTTAWAAKVKKIGAFDAATILARRAEDIELWKSLIKNEVLEEICQDIRMTKWDKNGNFKRDLVWFSIFLKPKNKKLKTKKQTKFMNLCQPHSALEANVSI